MNYEELVKALRIRSGNLCPGDICDRCEAIHFLCSDKVMHDAAAAIEALNRLLDQNTQRCEALRKQLREAHESYERHLNELEAQLPKRGKWIRVQEVDIPGEIHSVAFKCMCSMCRNEYLFPRIPRYCPDCGSMNTAKMEVQDGE